MPKTDGGPRFPAPRFREATRILGMRPAIDRPHDPEDNGPQESFHGKWSGESLSLWLRVSESFSETRATRERSIPACYENRPHSPPGNRMPIECRKKKKMDAPEA